jgi:hypothetical protein
LPLSERYAVDGHLDVLRLARVEPAHEDPLIMAFTASIGKQDTGHELQEVGGVRTRHRGERLDADVEVTHAAAQLALLRAHDRSVVALLGSRRERFIPGWRRRGRCGRRRRRRRRRLHRSWRRHRLWRVLSHVEMEMNAGLALDRFAVLLGRIELPLERGGHRQLIEGQISR